MKKLFGSDSRLFMIMTLLLELAEINILFIVCSLPVLTMGASFAAMYDSLYQLHRYGEGSFSAKQFLGTYKRVLKRAIPIWSIGLVSGGLMIYGLLLMFGAMEGIMRIIVVGVYIVFLLLLSGILQFQFFILAMTEEWNKDYIKDAFLLVVARFPYVIVTTLVVASPLVILMMTGEMLVRMLPLILLYWISCPAYVCVSIYTKIFKPFYPNWFDDC